MDEETVLELLGSSKDSHKVVVFQRETSSYDLVSFSLAIKLVWMQVLRFNMIWGFAKKVQVCNLLYAILKFKMF